MNTDPLAVLFERFRSRGSTAALARVFDASAPALLRIARRLTGDLAQAEDAVQSTFLAAIERSAAFDAARPLEPWLVGILVRQVGLLRRGAARVVDPARLEPQPAVGPEQAAEQAELAAAVESALRGLDEHDRAVLVPWLSGEARGRELAQRVGVGGSTLRMRLHRGLARLRRALPAGFGAGLVLSAAEREALGRARSLVLTQATRAAAGTAATTAAGTAGAKLVAALLIAGATIGGAALLRQTAARSKDGSAAPASAHSVAATAGAGDRGAVAAVRASDPAATDRPDAPTEPEDSGITTTTTATQITKGDGSEFVALQVVDEHLEPIAGAHLRIFDENAAQPAPLAEGASGSDGGFRLEPAKATSFRFVCEKEGYAREASGAMLRSTVRVVLAKGRPLAGRITRDDGAAVAGAIVELADHAARFVGPLATTSDPEGAYRFDHVDAPIRWVRARSRDGRRVGFASTEQLQRDPEGGGDLVLHETSRLEIRVRAGSDGRPLAGALVVVVAGPNGAKWQDSLARVAGRFQDLFPFGAVARTDDQGRASVEALPSQTRLRVTAVAEGFAPAWCRVASLHAGETQEASLALDAPCRAAGCVRDAAGAPIARASVALEPIDAVEELGAIACGELGGDPFGFRTTTRADGSFELDGLPPVPDHLLRFGANHEEAEAPLHLAHAGDVATGIELTLGLRVKISGRVVAEDGAAPKGTQVFRAPASDLAQLDDDGNFEFVVNSRLGVTVVAIAPGYVHAQESLAGPLDLVSNPVTITLKRGSSIEGRVEDASHRPVGGARVIAWPADPTPEEVARTGGWLTEMNLASTTSSADGAFRLRGLPERKVRLMVTAAGFDEFAIQRLDPGAQEVAVVLTPSR